MRALLALVLLLKCVEVAGSVQFHERPEVREHLTSGPVIIVNIPEFKLRLYRDGELQLESRVILGKETRQTPEMVAEIQHVILNPYWNISNKLARADILPRYVKDPKRLERDGYQLVSGWNPDSRVVDPLKVDIGACVRTGDCSFRIRQTPGDHNFLGAVKFSMPNPYNVYIHDTPAKHLFSRKKRTFSSGCIRTDSPIELAIHLLGKSRADVESRIASGTRQEIYLETPVKVVVVNIMTPDGIPVYPTKMVYDQ